ncbi:hypothetical protein OO007_15415 [Cocleimonas sp. KMM 6892]|uniref:hypothetical protein n=1 Tax=unclassified Cocleimonas TaxID=2639732 RepID=UPI002DBEBDF8|nr:MULTISPECIES: hypothetical protein [unclassified Cocleimonas]MEB8433628.1 hypothetical protein [Cocleimonas sp. KMM 6892]MEC4716439.1 hypothetical protein [Cocleimonas sp. KMM 6895]MEC4745668.1 hypothetical protein [Cocleimonas sp. KMM 6896]
MSSSGGMSQLLKGIMIGIVLILAIVGTMSLLDKSKSPDDYTNINNSTSRDSSNIPAPSISINPQNSTNTENSDNNTNNNAEQSGQLTSNQEKTNADEIVDSTIDADKPVLEEEEPEKPEEIQFGMLTVSSINPDNKEKLNASFVILNKENTEVAKTSNVNTATYKLPVGEYKITATLTPAATPSDRPIPTVEKTQQLSISADSKTDQVFELKPPLTIGILQVSAVSTSAGNKAVRSNFIVQKDNGETVATRNNVTNSLFKLNAGSYKVTVRSGSISDFRTVVVEAGESTQETFKLQEAAAQGRVLIRVFDTRSSTPVNADITISDVQGNLVQELKSVTKTEISLAQGNYKIRVAGPTGQSNKNIRVIAGQSLSEIFRFDAPQVAVNTTETSTTNVSDDTETSGNSSDNGIQITENVTIKAVEPQQETNQVDTQPAIEPVPEADEAAVQNASITILARNAADNRPIKSNIYIQTPAGQHLDKKIYVDSGTFELAPGVYKITVRSKNRKNNVKTIRISANQQLNETFLMDNLTAPDTTERSATPAPQKPAKPVNNGIIPSGFLNVLMQADNNQNGSNQNLNTHFIVATKAGKKIVELTSVKSGNFKLDTGQYVVTAIHKNQRRSQNVTIRENQNTRLIFRTSDFGVRKGLLRSRIIDEAGRPLKGNLLVKDMRGRIVARANGVSIGEFELAPIRHTVSVNYRGLSGSEVVRVASGETTIQTFTIASNSPAPANRNAQKNDTQELKRIIRDKIKEEIQKQF